MQGFLTTLSFVERFEWVSLGKECSLELFFQASSAFKIFEAGLRSLELFFWASSAFKIFEAGLWSLELFFGLAAPSRYSRQGFGPSNCFLG
jgi:hypothetical protein